MYALRSNVKEERCRKVHDRVIYIAVIERSGYTRYSFRAAYYDKLLGSNGHSAEFTETYARTLVRRPAI